MSMINKKKNRIVRCFIFIMSLVFLLTLNISKTYASEEKDVSEATVVSEAKDFSEAKEITKFHKKLSGYMPYNKEHYYYKMNITRPVKIEIVITSKIEDRLCFNLYNEDGVTLREEYCTYNGKKTAKKIVTEYLDIGIFYIEFSTLKQGSKGEYSFTPSLQTIVVDDREPNNTVENSKDVKMNITYNGLISATDKIDIYRIELKKAGVLNAVIGSKIQGDLKATILNEENSTFTEEGIVQYNTKTKKGKSFHFNKKVEAGTYYIKVESINNVNTGKYTIKLNNKTAIKTLKASQTKKTMNVGEEFTLYAAKTPSNAKEGITYSSSDKSVATVNSKGKIVARKAGKTTITIKSVDGGLTASCVVTVQSIAVQKVELNAYSSTLKIGENISLKATITPTNATNKKVTWSSSNTSIATVNSKGVVTAIHSGSCTITVTTVSNSMKATCKISVRYPYVPTTIIEKEIESITMETSVSLGVNETISLNANYSPSDATKKDLVWSSSNSAVATVNASGQVAGVSKGVVIVTVTALSGKTAYCTVMIR